MTRIMIALCVGVAALSLALVPTIAGEGKDHASKDHGGKEKMKKAKVGEPAPNFTLTTHEGKKITLADFFKDTEKHDPKVVVLEWINPDCPFVKRHYREGTFKEMAEKYKAKDVAWVAINSTHYYKPKQNAAWAKEHDLAYPILADPSGKVGRMYGATHTPHMYVIDREGVLRYQGAIDNAPRGRKEGEAYTNYAAEALDAVLAGRTVEKQKTKAYGCTVKYAKKEKQKQM